MPRTRIDAPVLGQRQLGRALLARQLLLERASLTIPEALHQVGGLQTQYAPSGYIGLWSRIEGLRREELTRALEDRIAVQATLMRGTIHLVAATDYWPFAAGIRRALREWALRQPERSPVHRDWSTRATELRAALADGPRSTTQLGDAGAGFVGHLGLWVDLVRVPPSGTWERRRADILGLAETWLGPDTSDEPSGLRALLHAYLRGFGPAAPRDVASWAGVPVSWLREAAADPTLRRFQDEAGRELLDLPDAPLPDADAPAPVRLLPHWDANLLVHARRTGLLPEAYRSIIFTSKRPFSAGVVLVDGRVVGEWSITDGHVVPTLYEPLAADDQRAVADEVGRLDAWQSA